MSTLPPFEQATSGGQLVATSSSSSSVVAFTQPTGLVTSGSATSSPFLSVATASSTASEVSPSLITSIVSVHNTASSPGTSTTIATVTAVPSPGTFLGTATSVQNTPTQSASPIRKPSGLGNGAVAGIVIAILAFVIGITFFYIWFRKRRLRTVGTSDTVNGDTYAWVEKPELEGSTSAIQRYDKLELEAESQPRVTIAHELACNQPSPTELPENYRRRPRSGSYELSASDSARNHRLEKPLPNPLRSSTTRHQAKIINLDHKTTDARTSPPLLHRKSNPPLSSYKGANFTTTPSPAMQDGEVLSSNPDASEGGLSQVQQNGDDEMAILEQEERRIEAEIREAERLQALREEQLAIRERLKMAKAGKAENTGVVGEQARRGAD